MIVGSYGIYIYIYIYKFLSTHHLSSMVQLMGFLFLLNTSYIHKIIGLTCKLAFVPPTHFTNYFILKSILCMQWLRLIFHVNVNPIMKFIYTLCKFLISIYIHVNVNIKHEMCKSKCKTV